MARFQACGGKRIIRVASLSQAALVVLSRARFATSGAWVAAGLAMLSLVDVPTVQAVEAAGEPATVEAAARVLDLRTFPVPQGAKVSDRRTLAMLMFEAPGGAKAAFDLLRRQFTERGWKELPGSYQDDANASGHFSKEGFIVAASTSNVVGDPRKDGWSRVSVVNHGNIAPAKLPAPPGVKPFYPSASEASYITEAKVPETAAACRKLLLAAGWTPYGTASSDPESPMMYFKRNAIRLMAWVSSAPAQGGKTIIKYSTDLLSADLPVPPDATDPRYNDGDRSLRFDSPDEQAGAIVEFYQQQLPKQAWKPTTERPVVDERKGTQFLIFRNPQGDMISLDLTRFTDIVRVKVQHQTAAKVAELDRLAEEEAERRRQELARKSVKVKVAVPLPALAAKIEQDRADLFEFTLGTGGGPVAFGAFREHFLKDGWSEEEGTRTEANTGSMSIKKGEATIRFSYFDSGITDAEITVSGSPQVMLQPLPALDKSPKRADAPQAGKKPGLADIPGLPKLPAGVELPDIPEVDDLLKTLKNADADKPAATSKAATSKAAASKTATNKGAPSGKAEMESAADKMANKQADKKAAASGPVKVAEIPLPADTASVEYNKTVKMIKVTSPSDTRTLAAFLTDALTDKGWGKASPGLVTDSSAILKLSKGDALLTIFIHGNDDDDSEMTLVCKGVVWDVVPQSKTAAKKPATQPASKPATQPPAAPRVASKPNQSTGGATSAKSGNAVPAAGPRITVADQKQTGATVWIGEKAFKLEYGLAYESKSNDEQVTEVLLAMKPIAVEKVLALLNQGKDADDAVGFEPHMKLRFVAAGKLTYLFLYVDGLSVNLGSPGPEKVQAEITVKDGRARGKAVLQKPEDFFKKQYRFEANFDAKMATGKAGTPDATPAGASRR